MADAAGTRESGGGAGLYKVIKFISWLVYAFVVFAIIVLLFGFVLLLFAAKPIGFAETIYRFGSNFMNPFAGIIAPTELSNGGVISWNALVAIAAYAVLAWVVSMIVGWASSRVYRAQRPTAAVQAPASAVATPAPTTSAQPAMATPPVPAPAAQPAAAPAAPPAAAVTPAVATEPATPAESSAPAEPASVAESPVESTAPAESAAPAGQEPSGAPADTA